MKSKDGRKYITLTSQCLCGFTVPFVAVVNYLIDPLDEFSLTDHYQNLPVMYPSSEEAILFECRFLTHIGKYQLTLNLLANTFADTLNDFDRYFFRGFCHEKLDHLEQALNDYDHCLSIKPDHGETWYNKWCILNKLGRYDEAVFHKSKYRQLLLTHEDTLHPLQRSDFFDINAQGTGLNGKVQVIDHDNKRSLLINQELQSGVWMKDGKASDVPSNPDAAGLLLNGCHFHANSTLTKGVILGLGAGSGIISLLANFDRLSLTVIENDPTIVQLVLRHFPLIRHYIECKRLNIKICDAYEYVHQMQSNADFIVIDLYQGNFEPCPKLFDISFFQVARSKCELLSVNLKHPESRFDPNSLIHYFSWPSIGLSHYFKLESSYIAGYEIFHTVLFNQSIKHIDTFIPYQNRSDYLAVAYRRDFDFILKRKNEGKHNGI